MNQGIYLSCGSNMGDRKENFDTVLELLEKSGRMEIVETSPIYETLPIGPGRQKNYWNAVVRITTSLSPHDLLNSITEIENRMGRQRTVRWGERIIDIDILLYENILINDPDLQIPHPRLQERSFVLRPLADLNPNLVISERPVYEWLNEAENTILGRVPYPD